MKVIQTRYNGHHFRSRTEARWAVYFDALGIRWEYEPEGFKLNDGSVYLPDFYFPIQKMYGEVKPEGYDPESDPRHEMFVEEGDFRLVFFIGVPGSNPQTIFELITVCNTPDPDYRAFYDNTGYAFGDYTFGKYDEFAYFGESYMEEFGMSTPGMDRAIRLAKEARFGKDQKVPKKSRTVLDEDVKHWIKAYNRSVGQPDFSKAPPCPECGADSWRKLIIESRHNPALFNCLSCGIEYDFDRKGLKK